MIAFIDDNRAAHGVEPICRVLPIAPSTYHAQVAQRADTAKTSMRAKRDARLRSEITGSDGTRHFKTYGPPRLQAVFVI